MDITSTVATFNQLPRNPLSPSGLVSNHWHFSVRHVTLSPPGLMLQIVNPASGYVHVEGPVPLQLQTASVEEKAIVWAALLLKVFANKPDLFHLRPWSWSTVDEALAHAISEKLREWGVRDGLHAVGIAGEEENKLADESWASIFARLQGMSTG